MLPGSRVTGQPRCCHRSVTALPGGRRSETGLGWAHGGCGRCSGEAGRLGDRGQPWRRPWRGGGPRAGPGWVVYVTARSSAGERTGHLPGTVEQAADAVTAAGGLGVAVPCDHRDDTAVRAVAARITADHGRRTCSLTTRGPVTNGSTPAGGGMERAVLGAADRVVRRDVRRRGTGALRRGGGVRAAAHRDPAQPGGDGLLWRCPRPSSTRSAPPTRWPRRRTTASRWPPRSSWVSTAWPRWPCTRTGCAPRGCCSSRTRWTCPRRNHRKGLGRAISALASDSEVMSLTGQALTVKALAARYGVDVSS